MVPTAAEKPNTAQIVNHKRAVPLERPFLYKKIRRTFRFFKVILV
jgi:hypothetical protein